MERAQKRPPVKQGKAVDLWIKGHLRQQNHISRCGKRQNIQGGAINLSFHIIYYVGEAGIQEKAVYLQQNEMKGMQAYDTKGMQAYDTKGMQTYDTKGTL